jgi:hypothetical protein
MFDKERSISAIISNVGGVEGCLIYPNPDLLSLIGLSESPNLVILKIPASLTCLKRCNPDLLKGTTLSSLEDPNRDLLKVGAVYKFLILSFYKVLHVACLSCLKRSNPVLLKGMTCLSCLKSF